MYLLFATKDWPIMDNVPIEKISAIISNEKELEELITQLLAESVARSDISIQASPGKIKEKYGERFINPQTIQESNNPPITDPILEDDFGWVVGFSFAIPLFVCLIFSIFILGDVHSSEDSWYYGTIGAIVGSIIGFLIASYIRKKHKDKIIKQEQKGGFVIWVTTHSETQRQQVISILKKHHPKNIKDSFINE